MALRCGLHAVNAVCAAHSRVPSVDADELDAHTVALHAREREVHPDGCDNAPHPDGYYPVEALMMALRRRHLRVRFVRHAARHLQGHHHTAAAAAEAFAVGPNVLGYIAATGGHYVAVVRAPTGWRLIDNGTETARTDAASPLRLLAAVAGVCAVLRVARRRGGESRPEAC